MAPPELSVSQFVEYCSETISAQFPDVTIVGEVSSFKISQGKWVFFDLKDDDCSINCFIPVWSLRQPLEDGMKVRVCGTPKLTKWGKFSFTVRLVMPVGEGNIKKSFELLKKKLTTEGLFAPESKRPLPPVINKIGVISSTQAAGYADFIKILGERWGGLDIQVCHTQVQGIVAPDQIIRALNYLNERGTVDVIAIIRGGGSTDDLSAFNDEQLVRAIAASKIPVITGIGHEVDETLSDLAADIVASTPSNAAQMLTPDRTAILANIHSQISHIGSYINSEILGISQKINSLVHGVNTRLIGEIERYSTTTKNELLSIYRTLDAKIDAELAQVKSNLKILDSLNPAHILAKGYAIIRGEIDVGSSITLETSEKLIDAKITDIRPNNSIIIKERNL